MTMKRFNRQMAGRQGVTLRPSRHVLGLLGGGLLASAALAATAVSSSLGGFSATVTNNAGAAGSGTLLLQEGIPASTCISTGTGATSSSSVSTNDNTTCPTDLFASTNLAPGLSPASVTVTLTNPGSLAGSSLSFAPGSCVGGNNTSPVSGVTNTYFGTDTAGFCGKVDVTIENDTGASPACVFPTASSTACGVPSSSGTLANLTSETLPGIAAGAHATYKVSIVLDPSATNADQGLQATVPLTWTLNQ